MSTAEEMQALMLETLRDLLFEQPVVLVDRAHCEIGEESVAINANALFEILEDRIHYFGPTADTQGVDFDNPDPPPAVAYTSPRNADPAYRAAREEFARRRAEESLSGSAPTDGPVVTLPIAHRSELSEAGQVAAALGGEIFEQYAGKNAGIYVVHMPCVEADLDASVVKLMLLQLTILIMSPVSMGDEEDWQAVARRSVPWQAAWQLDGAQDAIREAYPDFPDALKKLVEDGAFVVDGAIPQPDVLGETDEDALLLAYRMPDRVVMLLVN
ncbi:hypothetical protein [Acidithiobacillus sp.]|uniref:hypothetical protein n=1 Tax=Acidithiobacillus sp. TaxID=1872118 RepID=UPI003CFEE18C